MVYSYYKWIDQQIGEQMAGDGIRVWWAQAVSTGQIAGQGLKTDHINVSRTQVYAEYAKWAEAARYQAATVSRFGVALRRIIPELDNHQMREGASRFRVYVFPPLDICRYRALHSQFEDILG